MTQVLGSCLHRRGTRGPDPACAIREALSKEQQKRFNDAAAIAEAAGRASMLYVPLKTTEQLELQALHRVRRRFIVERTAVINQMRARALRDSRSDHRALS